MEITNEVAAKVLATVDAGLCSGVGVAEPGKMCVEAAVCYALGLPHGDDPACVSRALRSFKIKLNDASWSSNAARTKGLRRLALIQLGSAGHLDDREFARRCADLAIRKAVPAALRSAASIQKDPKHKALLLEHAVICEREGTRKAVLDARGVARAAAAAAAYAAAAAAAYAAAYAAYAAADAADASADAASDDAAAAADAAADAAAAYAPAAVAATYDAAAAADAAAAYAAAAVAATYDAAAAADAAAAYAAAAVAVAAAAATYDAAAAAAARDKSLADFAEAVVQILIEMKIPGVQWLEIAPIAEAA